MISPSIVCFLLLDIDVKSFHPRLEFCICTPTLFRRGASGGFPKGQSPPYLVKARSIIPLREVPFYSVFRATLAGWPVPRFSTIS